MTHENIVRCMVEHIDYMELSGFHIVTEMRYRFLYDDPTVELVDNSVESYSVADGSAEKFISWLYDLKKNLPKNKFYLVPAAVVLMALYKKYQYNKEALTST